jgi:hypothetical protein
MTKIQAVSDFKENYLPFIPKNDKPAKRQAWNDFTDMLCKDGEITYNQYQNWTQPACVK